MYCLSSILRSSYLLRLVDRQFQRSSKLNDDLKIDFVSSRDVYRMKCRRTSLSGHTLISGGSMPSGLQIYKAISTRILHCTIV